MIGWFILGAAVGIVVAVPTVYLVVRWRSRVFWQTYLDIYNKHTFNVGPGPTEPPPLLTPKER